MSKRRNSPVEAAPTEQLAVAEPPPQPTWAPEFDAPSTTAVAQAPAEDWSDVVAALTVENEVVDVSSMPAEIPQITISFEEHTQLLQRLGELEALVQASRADTDTATQLAEAVATENNFLRDRLATQLQQIEVQQAKLDRLAKAAIYEVRWSNNLVWVAATSIEEALAKVRSEHGDSNVQSIKSSGIKVLL